MWVLVNQEPPFGYLHSLDCEGTFDVDSIDDALHIRDYEELISFLNYLSFYFGMDYAYYYKVLEI